MAKRPTFLTATATALALGGATAAVTLLGCGRAPQSTSFADCSDCPAMVTVPAGAFTIGSPANELLRGLETQRRVTIPAFALSQYEVTFAQWDACVAGGGCRGPAATDEGWGRDNRPAINVTWDMAKSYAEWLSTKTGKAYRLPSEAEWEYAARAGTTTPFSFGETISADQANYNGSTSYGQGRTGSNRQRTQPVGEFPANGFGLHEMHGNVAEWTEDCWQDGYADDAPVNGGPYITPECGEHATRGGSWESPPEEVRSAARAGTRRDQQSPSLGFRVARAVQ